MLWPIRRVWQRASSYLACALEKVAARTDQTETTSLTKLAELYWVNTDQCLDLVVRTWYLSTNADTKSQDMFRVAVHQAVPRFPVSGILDRFKGTSSNCFPLMQRCTTYNHSWTTKKWTLPLGTAFTALLELPMELLSLLTVQLTATTHISIADIAQVQLFPLTHSPTPTNHEVRHSPIPRRSHVCGSHLFK